MRAVRHAHTAAVVIVFFAVALIACYLAAKRINTIEPESLLREG